MLQFHPYNNEINLTIMKLILWFSVVEITRKKDGPRVSMMMMMDRYNLGFFYMYKNIYILKLYGDGQKQRYIRSFSVLNFLKRSWLISRPFSPFEASLARIQKHDLLLKMRFPVFKLQFLLQKWIQHPLLPLGHLVYAFPITKN